MRTEILASSPVNNSHSQIIYGSTLTELYENKVVKLKAYKVMTESEAI